MRDETIYLKEILEQIKLIESSIKNSPKSILESDLNLRDATIRRIEVIGEAVKSISDNTKKKYPEIAWKDIAGTRDNIIHRYFGIDLDIIWNIAKKDIPSLKINIQKILDDLKSKEAL
jgi:uncharacterized protein with HEPN domain